MEEALRESHVKQKKNRRLLLFPTPLQGHINPMIQLAHIFYSKGFSITILHNNFNSPDPSKYPFFSFHLIPEGLSEKEASEMDATPLIALLNEMLTDILQDHLVKLLLEEEEEPIASLIVDASWHFTQEVADDLKLSRFVLRTSNACSFLVYNAFPLLLEKGYMPVTDSRLEELVPELPPLRVKDLPDIKMKKPDDFYNLVAGMIRTVNASSGLIWNSCEDLEQAALIKCRQVFKSPMFNIGPFHNYFPAALEEDQKNSISWLDTQMPNSVIYVSFGTIAVATETEFLHIAWGLANSKQRFLWVVRPGSVRGSEWLQLLPDKFHQAVNGRGKIVKWAPQRHVLAHPAVGGFWTHCGWNSTFESICEGVPMICHPSFGDQKVNARYVSDVWRVGIHLEGNRDRVGIERAIRMLMVDAEGQEIRQRSIALKDKIDDSLKQGGSSYRSLDSLVSSILSAC
uniref:UDP-glycosyltransferase 1 n=1 Tax=Linum usitatissimum TaxID=4006 RepID=I2BH74_LINUS|nr:UDP-glycosyltransferase 1 [Linum usitatissimum]